MGPLEEQTGLLAGSTHSHLLGGPPPVGLAGPRELPMILPQGEAADPLYQRLLQNTQLMEEAKREKIWKDIKSVRAVAQQLIARGLEPSEKNLRMAGVSTNKQRRLAWFLGIPFKSEKEIQKEEAALKAKQRVIFWSVTSCVLLALVAAFYWFRGKVTRSLRRMRHLYKEAYLHRLQKKAERLRGHKTTDRTERGETRGKERQGALKVLRLNTGKSTEYGVHRGPSSSSNATNDQYMRGKTSNTRGTAAKLHSHSGRFPSSSRSSYADPEEGLWEDQSGAAPTAAVAASQQFSCAAVRSSHSSALSREEWQDVEEEPLLEKHNRGHSP
ncbi:hypothetical protein cyc_00694 [Cyclospora cayetanensis]|uniref:Transmembrane protein n=1 Tax=Cyclospora cayetanensis TaxID=88456 RepID=A0A1D3CRD0_9EIME|nr:hypothetical protein cyc_00694 [Cyclospora cayetanensis]